MEYDKKTKLLKSNVSNHNGCSPKSHILGNQQMLSLLPAPDENMSRHSPVQFEAAGREPIQRQIQIRGLVYTNHTELSTAAFRRVFGGEAGYLPALSDIVTEALDFYLQSAVVYSFHSFQHLLNSCLPRAGNWLNIYPGVIYGHPPMNPVIILMTGSRTADYAEANMQAGLPHTPPGYTWHHIEGIVPGRTGGFQCSMILVNTIYHQTGHQGGVYEYEAATGTNYG